MSHALDIVRKMLADLDEVESALGVDDVTAARRWLERAEERLEDVNGVGAKALASTAKPLATRAEAGAKGGRGKKARNAVTSFRGNDPSYLTRRIARDRRARTSAKPERAPRAGPHVVAESILQVLREHPEGLPREDITIAVKRDKTACRRALARLYGEGRAQCEVRPVDGRRRRGVWTLAMEPVQ